MIINYQAAHPKSGNIFVKIHPYLFQEDRLASKTLLKPLKERKK